MAITFAEFQASRVHCANPAACAGFHDPINDETRGYVYLESFFIEEMEDGQCTVAVGRLEFTGDRESCERFLWDNFAMAEVNGDGAAGYSRMMDMRELVSATHGARTRLGDDRIATTAAPGFCVNVGVLHYRTDAEGKKKGWGRFEKIAGPMPLSVAAQYLHNLTEVKA